MTKPQRFTASTWRARALFISALALSAGCGRGSSGEHAGHDHEAAADAPPADGSTASASVEYVCPMHPQIRQPEFGTCPICMMDLVPVSGGGEDSVIDIAQFSAGTAALMGLATHKVVRAVPTRTVSAFGRVVSAQDGEARVVAWAEGRIESLRINKDGQTVRAGETVARIFSPELASLLSTLRTSDSGSDSAGGSSFDGQLRRAAQQQLRDRGLSDRDIASLAQSKGSSIPLRAAHSGTVIERHVRVGDYVSIGDPIVSLAQTSAVWVELSVDARALSAITVGSEVDLRIDGEEPQKGTVVFIAPTIDAASRRGTVRVTLNDSDAAPRLETFVRAELHVEAGAPAVVVDDTSVLWTGKRSIVFIVDRLTDPPIYQPVDVTVGELWGDKRVILEGLYPGEEVVSEGAFRIDATLYLSTGAGMLHGGDHE